MAVAYDSAPTAGGVDFAVTTVSSPATGWTIGSGSDRAVIVGLAFYTDITGDSFTVTCSGATCSAITGAALWATGGGQARGAKLFSGVAPASGTNKQATASWSTSAAYVAISAVVATGVNQSTPVANGTTASGATPCSVVVTSATNDLTVSCAMDDQGGTAPTSNQTRVTTESGFAMDYAAGASSVTHTWTSANAQFTLAGASFTAASSGTQIAMPLGAVATTGALEVIARDIGAPLGAADLAGASPALLITMANDARVVIRQA